LCKKQNFRRPLSKAAVKRLNPEFLSVCSGRQQRDEGKTSTIIWECIQSLPFQGASNALVLVAIRAQQEGGSIGMWGNWKVGTYKNFWSQNKTTLILIHVVNLKKVIYKGTKIGVVLFWDQTFLFWASPPCQGIRTLQPGVSQ
jgi:hypothetical protein